MTVNSQSGLGEATLFRRAAAVEGIIEIRACNLFVRNLAGPFDGAQGDKVQTGPIAAIKLLDAEKPQVYGGEGNTPKPERVYTGASLSPTLLRRQWTLERTTDEVFAC